MRRCSRLLACIATLASAPLAAQDVERPQLALMGTIPIFWGESDGFTDLVRGEAEPHWARALIEERADPVPLDYLSAEALAPHRYLLLAQPRGLSAEENVALDAWVREGGQVLLFADPWMTGDTRYRIGDRRRPQDVALLSPILTHWGLELQFDEAQVEGLATFDHFGDPIPVNMRGQFAQVGESTSCAIPGDGLLAHCSLGLGQVLLVADAAMLDHEGPHDGAEEALQMLMEHIFPEIGDHAGMAAAGSRDSTGTGGESTANAPPDLGEQQGEGHIHHQ